MAVSARTRFEVLKRDDFTCRYCGRKAPEVKLHVDHIVPQAEGGTHDAVNLVTACQDCNLGKADKPLTQKAPVPDIPEQVRELAGRKKQIKELLERSQEVRSAEDDLTREPYNYWFDVWHRDSIPDYNVPKTKTLLRYIEAIGVQEVMDAMDVTGKKFGQRIEFGVLPYFHGVCKRKIADVEGRVTLCTYCKKWIVLTPEEKAQDAPGWHHSGCAEKAKEIPASAPQTCEECGDAIADGLYYCDGCWNKLHPDLEDPALDLEDDIAVEVAVWDKLAAEAGL